ncbi:MAG: metal-dependent hydrolase [Deltaproteobacteria bacterium]|nr:metal-dependent hydrolase [Deltaproteobacteria bacterium]
MDNLTHALAGIVVAEAALEIRRRRTGKEAGKTLTRAAWLASAGANNVPDLDFVYTGVIERPLGYLIHHRGHTHTLLLAPLLALLPWLASLALERWGARRENEKPPDGSHRGLLYGLAVLGCVTHLVMDATNNYGVHPFWPFDARWYFGDTIFIVEPLWWVALSAPLVMTASSRAGRALLVLPSLAAIGLAIVSGVVLPPFVALLGALAPLLLYASSRLFRPSRTWLALGLGVVVPLTFAVTGAMARARGEAVLATAFPEDTLHDLVLNPMPGNPLCWNGLSVQTRGDQLSYRRLAISVAPQLFSAEGCHTDPPRETSAPRVPIFDGSTVDVQLFDTLEVPRDRLRTLAEEDCRVSAFMLFSRAPFVVEAYDAHVLGDARYDMSRELSWSKMSITEPIDHARCPGFLPGWEPPRRDMLEAP